MVNVPGAHHSISNESSGNAKASPSVGSPLKVGDTGRLGAGGRTGSSSDGLGFSAEKEELLAVLLSSSEIRFLSSDHGDHANRATATKTRASAHMTPERDFLAGFAVAGTGRRTGCLGAATRSGFG
tara:strand:- start:61 stop:438 length:378 start_codon:yes stop_codon:yes gene_type:complete